MTVELCLSDSKFPVALMAKLAAVLILQEVDSTPNAFCSPRWLPLNSGCWSAADPDKFFQHNIVCKRLDLTNLYDSMPFYFCLLLLTY